MAEWIAAVSILDINEETSHSYAAIGLELKRRGRSIPANDLWVAALCRQYSMPLLSRDGHFDVGPGLRRLGW
jgi:tRNA(fMet)-specific endonuclease VapC